MKKPQDLYDYLKTTRVPRYENNALRQRVKNRLRELMVRDAPEQERSVHGLWKRGFILVFAGGAAAALLLLAVFIFLPLLSRTQPAAYPLFMAGALSGEATASYNGRPADLNVGQALTPGTTIKTADGATCDLRINAASLVRIYGRSTVTLEKKGDFVSLRLDRGTLTAHIERPDRPFPLRVTTDNCIIGIKSTTFLVAVDADKTTHVALLKGVLSITAGTGASAREYTLESGRELAVTLDQTELSTTHLSAGHKALLQPITREGASAFSGSVESIVCEIQPTPTDANVFINGRKAGSGPFTFLADKGRQVTLEVVRSGYEPYKSELLLNENRTFTVTLKKRDAAHTSDSQTSAAGTETAGAENAGADTTGSGATQRIRIDGNPGDWQQVGPLVTDPIGDIGIDTPEADITLVYLTRGTEMFYAGIAFAGGSIGDLASIEYRIDIMQQDKHVLSLIIRYEKKQLLAMLGAGTMGHTGSQTKITGDIAVGKGFIEVGFPLEAVEKYLAVGNVYTCKITSRLPGNPLVSGVVDKAEAEGYSFK
jgi:hypothetical protein